MGMDGRICLFFYDRNVVAMVPEAWKLECQNRLKPHYFTTDYTDYTD